MLIPSQGTINDFINFTFSCSCGKEHLAPIKFINIGENSLQFLPDLLKEYDYHKSYFIFDKTTFSKAGDKVCSIMDKAALNYSSYILDHEKLVPDEKAIGEILLHFDDECDHIIAVGSGTLNDLSRFISYRLKLPYMIIATAPSMDGFASTVAPLIVNHMKTTYEAHSPFAIIGDINILKDAPMEMLAAGIGDILGKYISLCEWQISHIITGEYYCCEIEKLVRHSIEVVVDNITLAKLRDPIAIKNIMEALVLSGIAMSFVKNSRPASGSEHHLAHYWEMMSLLEGKASHLHGTEVGIGTIAVLKAYELLMNKSIDFSCAKDKAFAFSKEKWDAMIKITYQKASDAVIDLENNIGKNDPARVLPRIDILQANWQSLKTLTANLPSADEVRSYLSLLGAPNNPTSIGIDKTTFLNSFKVAKDLRNRFGLLQILFDLGLTSEIAEEVWEYFQS
jgi:glycerol-1-phosphate dehydrogenase [NAD(P)+]